MPESLALRCLCFDEGDTDKEVTVTVRKKQQGGDTGRGGLTEKAFLKEQKCKQSLGAKLKVCEMSGERKWGPAQETPCKLS